MRRRLLAVVAIVSIVLVATLCYTSVRDPDAPRSDWPILQAATTSSNHADIVVGQNVQISPTDNTPIYWECVAAADPQDPKQLFAASVTRLVAKNETQIRGFCSHDAGATWQMRYQCAVVPGHGRYDPSVAYGLNSSLYLAYMDIDVAASATNRPTAPSVDKDCLVFVSSSDSGETWNPPLILGEPIDRPWLAVDTRSDSGSGNVYCLGQIEPVAPGEVKTHSLPVFYRSLNGLKSLSEAVNPHTGRTMINCRPASPLILSDGTIVIAYEDRYLKRKIRTWPRPVIYVSQSTDSGRTFQESQPVDTKWWHNSVASDVDSVEGLDMPRLAVDPGSRKFSDRLYCVWSDGARSSDATRTFFSFSADRGNTWTQPVVLSEQPMEGDGQYLTCMPTIAVNNQGVVVATWYDRRGLPPTKRVSANSSPPGMFHYVSAGWNMRLRASLDGGETWSPSVQINEKRGRGEIFVGHTTGLAAGSDGVFHAVWVDNRTGKNKLWTATIQVDFD